MVEIRPLFVEGLAEVLAVDFSAAGGIPRLNEYLRWEDQEQALLSACSSLVAVIADQGSLVVQFSHFTVKDSDKEFLTSDHLASKTDASRYHILPEPAHMIMVQACLGILIRLGDHVDEESINTFPFARYAADSIADHVEFGDVLLHIQDEIDHLLDPDRPNFTAWLRLRGNLSRSQSPEALPLYYFAEFGFLGLVKHLIILILTHPQDSSTRGPCRMPLHIALRRGNTDISRLLLDCCDDVDVRDPEDQTALHLAAESRFLDVIQILLMCNANINARDNRERASLFRAITWIDVPVEPLPEQKPGVGTRVTTVAKQLLDYGADVHVWDVKGQTPLHRASHGNHFDVIQLLENRASPHVRNNKGQTPLHLALGWNQIERMG